MWNEVFNNKVKSLQLNKFYVMVYGNQQIMVVIIRAVLCSKIRKTT